MSSKNQKDTKNVFSYKLLFPLVKVINVPSLGDSITEGSILEYKKDLNQYVNQDEVIALIETDKVQVEIRSPFAGKLSKLFVAQGETVLIGKPLFEIDTSSKGEAPSTPQQKQPELQKLKQGTPQQKQPEPKKPEQTPQTLKTQTPKPPNAPQQTQNTTPSPPQTTPPPQPSKQQLESLPSDFPDRSEKRVPMNRMRQVISKRLKDAQNEYALLTTFQDCDMSVAMELRKSMGPDFLKQHGVKLGFMSLFIKSAVRCLENQPIVNAVIDGNEIVYRNYVDISVAVATPQGLVVPVLRNCETKSFADIEKELVLLSEKGKTGKITMEDMSGGTFTISNGGVFGSLMGTPIINAPQSAILGMHSIEQRAVVRDGQVVARPMMYLALTYDHRLIDGREAVIFLKQLAKNIEDPRRMLLEL